MNATASTSTEIRPFTFDVSDEELDDLRSRINATKWPDREVGSLTGRAARDDPGARRLLGDGLRLAHVRGALCGPAALRHRDRRGRHPLHPRPLQARGRAAADRHARLAGLDGRAAEDHRSAHQSHRARRERGGRLPSRDPVVAGPRVLGEADRDRLGPDPHRARLGRADEAPRIRPLRRAGRRLGQCRHRAAGPAEARRVCWASTPTCRRRVPPDVSKALAGRRPGAGRPLGRREERATRSWTTSSRPAPAMRRRWATARRRSTASRTRRSAWRPG